MHKLASAGLTECLEVFIPAAGKGVDFLKRTKTGLNALQLARNRKDGSVCTLLEQATEEAAQAAQEALLRELEEEDKGRALAQVGPGFTRVYQGSCCSTD